MARHSVRLSAVLHPGWLIPLWLSVPAACTDAPVTDDGADVSPGVDAGIDSGEATDAGDPERDAPDSDVILPDFAAERAALCADRDCGLGACDSFSGDCRCDSGAFNTGITCAPVDLCDDGDCAPCTPPDGPRLRRVASAETLSWQPTGGADGVEIAVLRPGDSLPESDAWDLRSELPLSDFDGQTIVVLARNTDETCINGPWYRATIDVDVDYGPPAGEPGTDAIAADDVGLSWASVVHDYTPGEGVSEEWSDATLALGPATGDSSDIVSLGEGGSLTIGFYAPVHDGQGWDLVVFENGFSATFLELAWVEVSSDGNRFARFDGASLTEGSVDAFGGIEPRGLGGLAGRFERGFGTPFDLAQLRQHPLVQTGALDLRRITHVRIVDSIGDGSMLDAFGRSVWDPYPTVESAGFDVEAVGAFFVTRDGE